MNGAQVIEATAEVIPSELDPTSTPMLNELLSQAKVGPADETYAVARRGISAFVSRVAQHEDPATVRVDKAAVDDMIAEIDRRMSAQINQILHDPEVQALESAWRGLHFMISKIDFRENVRVEVINCSKDDLAEDFEDSPETAKSGLYRTVYSAEYGTHGGKPYGMICSNYDFSPAATDVELLQQCAAVAAMAHAPFIGNAGPQFFGEEDFSNLPRLRDLQSLFEGPQYARWHSFRDSEDARNVGLCMPRFSLRLPYGSQGTPVKSFAFEEECAGKHEHYLWGASSMAFATRVADSFAKYRWCPNIIGPQSGGSVENLPLHHYPSMGQLQTKCPIEVQLTERREYELAEQGFIGLTFRKGSDNACFFSANSPQRPKHFGSSPEGKTDETNYRLGTQLPYMFIITRLAHYVKVLQREQIGSWKERGDLERELNLWLRQYVVDMDNPAPAVRSRKPLREASVRVEDVEGQPGWYRCHLSVRPHFKYMGASFSLSLVGKLDRE